MQAAIESPSNCRNPLPRTAQMIDSLSAAARADFESLIHVLSYPANVVLFTEHEPATGMYIVLEGEIRLSINSADGKRLSLRIARRGDLVGLSALLSGGHYTATAETLYPAKLGYIEARELLAFLTRHPDAYSVVVEEISRKFSTACEQLRTVALSNSAPEKIARLLLDWSANGLATESGIRIRFSLTHEQIGEFIGASRETVTRTMANLKHQRLIKLNGSMLTIPNKAALVQFADGHLGFAGHPGAR